MSQTKCDDQQLVFQLLQDPRTHGLTEPVIRVDTHGAAVFLAGPDVYKVKRAVRFPFMDFSTLEKRHAACQAEIAVNRENAPNIYRGVVPITRHAGHMQLGGDGEIVEWAVHLRRFDENSTLDHLAARGPLGPKVTLNLAEAIATSHRRAPRRDGEVATNAFHRLLNETARELMQVGGLFPADQAAMYTMLIEKTFTKAELFLRRRGALGQVRRCHGDLHLGNIVLIDGDPVLFDSIEFDDAIATSDILYDVAFLIMDLCHRDLHQDANHLLNGYLLTCEDRLLQLEGLAALPLFMSLRAAVRAKVLAVQALGDSSKASEPRVALAYFETAMALLRPAPPQLIAIGGRSGTGKSTLAAAIAPSMGRQPGAIHVRSDVERKKYFGVAETTRLSAEAYIRENTKTVYRKMNEVAEIALRAGQSVIVDATYLEFEERQAAEAVADRVGVPFVGIWLEAAMETTLLRVAQRRGDASDATGDIVSAQAKVPSGALAWHKLDTGDNLEVVQARLLAIVQQSNLPAIN